jgi:hypothetical protein
LSCSRNFRTSWNPALPICGRRDTPTDFTTAVSKYLLTCDDRRIALDHREPQPQHDADGSDHADATVAEVGRAHVGRCSRARPARPELRLPSGLTKASSITENCHLATG